MQMPAPLRAPMAEVQAVDVESTADVAVQAAVKHVEVMSASTVSICTCASFERRFEEQLAGGFEPAPAAVANTELQHGCEAGG